MPTQHSTDDLVLDFTSYIKKFFPEYKFDDHNIHVIKNLGLWAIRSGKFNNLEPGWHIDRGIFLVGVPGVGKDVIFRLLRKYISYLRSPYGYGSRVVWQYAKEFQKDKVGYSCFDGDKGNLYYSELALSDEGSNPITCSRENVQHFGNKLLIGREIINIRNDAFIQFGWQTHFSSNCNDEQIGQIYGTRAVDRIHEMCNYMILMGESKRGRVPPNFIKNTNLSAPPPARETTVDEHKENKAILEEEYTNYLKDGQVTDKAALHYYLLRSYDCAVAGDDEIRDLMEMAADDYVAPHNSFKTINRQEDKTTFQWEHARKIAVIKFYQNLKKAGAKSIFNEVPVAIDGIVRSMVSENKSQQ